MSDVSFQPRVSTPGAVAFDGERGLAAWLAVAVVLVAFAGYGWWRAPVPGANEPNYIGKARFFWDPAWCSRDLFLQSSNPHWFFYATVGALTNVLPLEQTAWAARGLAWLSLALGWVALVRHVAPGRFTPIWSAAVFLGISASGNLSGEWLIGGVEGKSFSYAALFVALACAGRKRWSAAAVACGLSVSFHPVVGIWAAAALGFAIAWNFLESRAAPASRGGHPPGPASPADRRDETGGSLYPHRFLPLGLFVASSLPGLIPAVATVLDGSAPEVSRAAADLQVFYRLGHHLDPRRFAGSDWAMYGVLLAAWLILRPWKVRDAGPQLFFRFVVGTLLIAAVGVVIGFGPRWPGILKFYLFRLADLFLPIALSLEVARGIERIGQRAGGLTPPARPPRSAAIGHLVTAVACAWIVAAPSHDRNLTGWTRRQQADWIDACEWVAQHTPADALFLTPRYRNYTFKWYAGRAEYATQKDCPQDARSLLEWKRRLDFVREWRGTHAAAGYDAAALSELRQSTGIDYAVDWYTQPYKAPPLYRNQSFRVYELKDDPGIVSRER